MGNDDILWAVREIGLPTLTVRIEPESTTLVNIPTIFHTDPATFEHSVDLLGFDVDLSAQAISYEWHPGDGTSIVTTTPGRPYPAMEVTHSYREAATGLQPRVDVTYRIRFRVDGGDWSTLTQTITAQGSTGALDVREAAPVLTKP